jgi:hypothetical protein
MDLFVRKNSKKTCRTQEIKAKITQLLSLNEDVTVMVTELNCQDNCCPEVETVIALFTPGKPKIQATLPSSVEELTDGEIERLCRNIQNNPDHYQASPGAANGNNQPH